MLGKCLYCSKEFKYKPSQQNGKYCSNTCQQQFQKNQRIEEWLTKGVFPGKIALRQYLTETHEYKCSSCEISEWNNNPITLDVDHIDGNPYNNTPSNLRYLCPNCHSQTPTYKAKNKGSGRLNRRKHASVAQLDRAGLL